MKFYLLGKGFKSFLMRMELEKNGLLSAFFGEIEICLVLHVQIYWFKVTDSYIVNYLIELCNCITD